MAKFSIGDLVFRSKKGAHAFVRKILDHYEPGQEVSSLDDATLLYDLLMLHPDAKAKIGCGVDSLWVKTGDYGQKEFWLTRVDGTSTDWSFRECLYPRSQKTKALAGFRTVITEQILDFKGRTFGDADAVPCEVSGALVAWNEAHVDHETPFADLLGHFLSTKGVRLEDVEVESGRDGETSFVLSDQSLAFQWAWYHLENAKLRIVTKQVNLGSAKRRGQDENERHR